MTTLTKSNGLDVYSFDLAGVWEVDTIVVEDGSTIVKMYKVDD